MGWAGGCRAAIARAQYSGCPCIDHGQTGIRCSYKPDVIDDSWGGGSRHVLRPQRTIAGQRFRPASRSSNQFSLVWSPVLAYIMEWCSQVCAWPGCWSRQSDVMRPQTGVLSAYRKLCFATPWVHHELCFAVSYESARPVEGNAAVHQASGSGSSARSCCIRGPFPGAIISRTDRLIWHGLCLLQKRAAF